MPVLKPTHEFNNESVHDDGVPIDHGASVLEELAQAIRDTVETQKGRIGTPSPSFADFLVDEKTSEALMKRAAELIQSACDHAIAVAELVSYPPHRFAPYTCARAVLEACAHLSWLCDSERLVDTNTRFRRLFQSELDATREYLKRINTNPELEKDLECSADDFRELCQRLIDQTLENAKRLHIEPIPLENPSSQIRFFKQVPKVSKLVEDYYPSALIKFQSYSGVTHGKSGDLGNLALWLISDSDRNLVEIYSGNAVNLLFDVMRWLLTTLERYMSYHGWDMQDYHDTRDHYYQRLVQYLAPKGDGA